MRFSHLSWNSELDCDSSHINARFNFHQHPQVESHASIPFISSRLAGIPRRLMTEKQKNLSVCLPQLPSPSRLRLAVNREVLASRTSCLAVTGRWTACHTATGLSTEFTVAIIRTLYPV